jgi:ABC-type branched-subunit amino acid transport system permease subunit
MKRSIIIAVLAVLVTATMVVWILNFESRISGKAIAMGSIQLVVLVFAVLVVYKRWTAAKNKLPAEDEMSKSILRRGAATSYYVSLYMWIAFMYFEERIEMERSTLIGAGIMGMAIIYALSWVYHSYIRKSHD